MYFSQELDLNQLCEAIAKHLFIRREDIGVVSMHKLDTKKTAVVLQDVDGDFPFGVNIYTDQEWVTPVEPEFARLLCKTLDAVCLVADDNGDNPYRWLLIDREGIRPVIVDAPYFDGQCAFRVVSSESEASL